MSNELPVVIIGSGLAGYNVAKELRKLSDSIPLVMVTQDQGEFYSKPQLSTAMTRKKSADELVVNTAEQMQQKLSMQIMTETVVSKINKEQKVIELEDGRVVSYQALVLAMGASVNQPNLEGDAQHKVLSINDLNDLRTFQERIVGAKRVAILGSGLVGCEYANDLLNAGLSVELISMDQYPMQRLLPELLGKMMAQAFADNGVAWHFGQTITAVNTSDLGGVDVSLSSDSTLTVDLVLSAIGFKPNVQLAKEAGLNCAHAIEVNHQLQTSDPHIYAIGDCASVSGSWRPYVSPILHGSKVLADAVLGGSLALQYPVMPIVTKTPICPCVVVPPESSVVGQWSVEEDGQGGLARFSANAKQLAGFSLLGSAVVQRRALIDELTSQGNS